MDTIGYIQIRHIMTKPSNFIQNSDYATLKNDGNNTVSFTIPGSIAIPSSGTYSYSATYDVIVGSNGAVTKTFINSSVDSTKWFFTPQLQIVATGVDSVAGVVDYDYFVYITRVNATTSRMNVLIPNDGGTGGTLTTETTARTITVKVSSFLPPFTA